MAVDNPLVVQRRAAATLPSLGLLGDAGPTAEALNKSRVNYGVTLMFEVSLRCEAAAQSLLC